MSKLTTKEVLHVAKLAKLPLADDEVELFSKQLSEVVTFFDELNEVDTENVEPTHQTTGLTDVLRRDEIKPVNILSVEEAVSQAKNVYNNLFVVPRLIDDKS